MVKFAARLAPCPFRRLRGGVSGTVRLGRSGRSCQLALRLPGKPLRASAP
jgi:hypothetical protein